MVNLFKLWVTGRTKQNKTKFYQFSADANYKFVYTIFLPVSQNYIFLVIYSFSILGNKGNRKKLSMDL
jgi:hypothetical protein